MRALLASVSCVLLLPASVRASQTPEGPTLQDMLGGRTKLEANQRAALMDVLGQLPLDVLTRIPGFLPMDSDVIASNLPDMLNPANGNLWLPFTDLAVHSNGPDASLTRIYNTRDLTPGSFGVGFSWSFGTRLQNVGGGISVKDPDGGVRYFEAVKGQPKLFRFAMAGQTIEVREGSYIRTSPADGMMEKFDREGFLVERRTADGLAVKILRNQKGAPSAIVAANGRRVSFTTDTNGRITEAKDDAGRSVRYVYDDNRLTTVTVGSFKTTYKWSGFQVTAVHFPDGETLNIAYNASGWVSDASIMGQVFRAGYRFLPERPEIQFADVTFQGAKTRYEIDGSTGVVRVIYPSGLVETQKVDPACGCVAEVSVGDDVTTYGYDNEGRLTKVTTEADTIQVAYGARGIAKMQIARGAERFLFIYDNLGQVTRIEATGRPHSEIVRSASATEIRANGKVLRRFEYDAKGDMVRHVEGNKVVTVSYDAAGRPRRVQRNDHAAVELAYVADQYVPQMRVLLTSKTGTKASVLGLAELEHFFGPSARVTAKKAWLDEVPGVKVAGPVVMLGANVPSGAPAPAPAGPKPCVAGDTLKCKSAAMAACLGPELANLIPFVGYINPIAFDANTGEYTLNWGNTDIAKIIGGDPRAIAGATIEGSENIADALARIQDGAVTATGAAMDDYTLRAIEDARLGRDPTVWRQAADRMRGAWDRARSVAARIRLAARGLGFVGKILNAESVYRAYRDCEAYRDNVCK